MESTDLVTGAEIPASRYTYQTLELFLFSASTWNPHRVHFDQAYARNVEGHEDLLVQGPLQAAHLFQALTSVLGDGARLTSVSYRHLAALHVGEPVVMQGNVAEVDEQHATATVEMWMEREATGQRTTAGTAVMTFDAQNVTGR